MQDGCRIFESGKSDKMATKYQHHKLPSGLGYHKTEGKDEENLTHFLGHYCNEGVINILIAFENTINPNSG